MVMTNQSKLIKTRHSAIKRLKFLSKLEKDYRPNDIIRCEIRLEKNQLRCYWNL